MMKLSVILGLVALFVGPAAWAQGKAAQGKAAQAAAHHVVVQPDAIKWGPAPPGLPAGGYAAILSGDPRKPGPFVLRAKMPDGYKVAPHSHPTAEDITVLQGALLVGTGDKVDQSKMENLTSGAFWHTPAKMSHYVQTKGETIIQVSGMGPFQINYVNPADDPRKSKQKSDNGG